jgi:hypothetical protein
VLFGLLPMILLARTSRAPEKAGHDMPQREGIAHG